MMGILFLPAMTVGAQSGGGIGGRVASPDPANPRSRSIFIYTLKHGETKEDQLLVVNRTDEEQTITLGSVDGVVTNTGDYTCRQEAEPVEGSGSWVRLAKTEVTLPAGGEEKVDLTVTVPEKADVGEHNSCLTIMQKNQGDSQEAASGVRLRMRQAIRMVVTIPGDLKRDLSIDSFGVSHGSVLEKFSLFNESTFGNNETMRNYLTFKYSGAVQRYSLTVANKGNVSADVDMKVRIASIFGGKAADVDGEYPVVPGEELTKEFTTELRPLFGGWYKATPSIRFDKRLGAFGTQNDKAEYETISGEAVPVFLWPTQLGWVIIGTVLALLSIALWRGAGHSKRQRGLKRSSKKYTVKKADTIQTLAKKSKITWQELAELNDIQPPYSLEVGQKLLLPVVPRKVRKSRRPINKKKS